MKKILLLVCLVFSINISAVAVTNKAKQLLALVKLPPETVTREKVNAMLGKPARVEDSRKGSKWYYSCDSSFLVIRWRKGSPGAEKFSFNCKSTQKCVYDKGVASKLKEGKMDVGQAISLLGVPKDMTIKGATQIINYDYCSNRLRLFFRNQKLVDYAVVQYVKK